MKRLILDDGLRGDPDDVEQMGSKYDQIEYPASEYPHQSWEGSSAVRQIISTYSPSLTKLCTRVS